VGVSLCVCVGVSLYICVCYALVYMCESLGIWIFILCVSLWLMSYSSTNIFACVHITSMFMFPFFAIYLRVFFEDILCICNILKISFFLRLIICIFFSWMKCIRIAFRICTHRHVIVSSTIKRNSSLDQTIMGHDSNEILEGRLTLDYKDHASSLMI
jgi:hypothetical protein